MTPAVEARALVKRFGAHVAVDGVSFVVPRGATFGFLGPNGAGKTSTMRMMYGLSPVTGGTLAVLGLDIGRDGRQVRRRIGVCPQDSNLDMDMTTYENLLAHARFYDLVGANGRRRVEEMLDHVQLRERAHDRVSTLSGGMRRRVLLARALVNDPELLILDEPTTGLDPQSRMLLWERIKDMRRAGKTVILTTHYMDEAERLCTELVLMDRGRIIDHGAPKALVAAHIGREVLEVTIDPHEDARILATLGDAVRSHDRIGEVLSLASEDAEGMVERLAAAGIRPQAATWRAATLEDLFLHRTGRRLRE